MANPKRRQKGIHDRLRDLRGTLDELDNGLKRYEEKLTIYPLRTVSVHLYVLIFDKHPLLIELAEQKKYSLDVYILEPELQQWLEEKGTDPNMGGYDLISLSPDSFIDSRIKRLPLQEALKQVRIKLGAESLGLRQAIREVRDTEAAHHDLERPLALDRLDFTRGVQTVYRAIYDIAKVVSKLGHQFVDEYRD